MLTDKYSFPHTKANLTATPPVSCVPVPSLSQWRRWAANLCIRVFTEEAAVASDLEFSALCGPSSDAGLAGRESQAGAGACGCAWGDTGLGEQGLAETDSTGCSFSKLEASTSVLSEQRFLDGDGFVQDFSRLKEGKNSKFHTFPQHKWLAIGTWQINKTSCFSSPLNDFTYKKYVKFYFLSVT